MHGSQWRGKMATITAEKHIWMPGRADLHVEGGLRKEQNERFAIAFQSLVVAFRDVRAVIWDKDDLMVLSEPLHARAWTGAFRVCNSNFKYEDMPLDTRMKWVGRKEIDVAQIMVDYFKLGITAEELLRLKSVTFHELIRDEMQAMPGLFASLDLFRNNGFKIAMATSSHRDQIGLVFDRLSYLSKSDIASYFDLTVCGEDVKRGKPDPEIYRLTTERLGLKPKECVVLEDAQSGIRSAKAAGCRCIGVINLDTPPQNRSEADVVLDSLEQVPELPFTNWNKESEIKLRT